MSIASNGLSTVDSASGLNFARVVDRSLIHRRHPEEAFLTDAARTGPNGFVAAALLPAAHPHYAAHTGPSRSRDPMLLLECARQATTYLAHTVFGVEPDARFVLRNWSAEFTGSPAAEPAEPAETELVMTAVTRNPRVVRDRVRGMEYELELWAAEARLGRVRMEVGYISDAAYTVIRARKHAGPPPSSDDLDATPGHPVEPAVVGRIRATDAVLLDVGAEGRTVTARLRVPAENRSLFDHALDHVPAMVLVEAARQLAALAVPLWGGPEPDRTELVAMSSSFATYAELTEPVELAATPVAAIGADGGAVDVTFRQAGTEVAQVQVDLAIPAVRTERERMRGTA